MATTKVALARAAVRRSDAGRQVPWPLVGVLAVFFLSVLAVPIGVDATVGDEWVYIRPVENLVRTGVLRIPQPSAATVVFQAVWGWAFAAVAGLSFGVLRASTVVIVALSAIALWDLCRRSGVDAPRSAIGVAAVLLSPLAYVFSVTFMTDPHFAALVLLSTAAYARGLTEQRDAPSWTVAGAALAGCATLVRPMGLFLPTAALGWCLVTGRLRFGRAGLTRALCIAAPPVLAFALYTAWLVLFHGTFTGQNDFVSAALSAPPSRLWFVTRKSAVLFAVYSGFAVLPLVAGLLVSGLRRRWLLERRAMVGAAIAALLLVDGLLLFYAGAHMPLGASWLTPSGPGPEEVFEPSRAPLVGSKLSLLALVVCVLAFLVVTAAAARLRRAEAVTAARGLPGFVAAMAAGQFVGVVVPSIFYSDPLDRYLLPLLPFAVWGLLWLTRKLPMQLGTAWGTVAFLGVIAVAGAHDRLVMQGAVWDLDRRALAMGIELDQLDGGISWTGYQTYEQLGSGDLPPHGDPYRWWIRAWGSAIDPIHFVAGEAFPDHDVLARTTWESWLPLPEEELFLLRR